MALLNYRDTVGVTGFSPAQVLMGRRLRTRVSKEEQRMLPSEVVHQDVGVSDALEKKSRRLTSVGDITLGTSPHFRQVPGCGYNWKELRRQSSALVVVQCFTVEKEQSAILQLNQCSSVPFQPEAGSCATSVTHRRLETQRHKEAVQGNTPAAAVTEKSSTKK